MWERICPNHLDWTSDLIKVIYTASCLIQSPCNVGLSACVNTAGHCPENSQQASGSVDLGVRRLARNTKNTNIQQWWRRVFYSKTPTKKGQLTQNHHHYGWTGSLVHHLPCAVKKTPLWFLHPTTLSCSANCSLPADKTHPLYNTTHPLQCPTHSQASGISTAGSS